MLELLRREHDPRYHLLVTTSSTEMHVSVGVIGDEGLREVAPFESSSEFLPASIPWASIVRIDRIELRHRRGRTFGIMLGGLAGGFTGAALGHLVSSIGGGERRYDEFGAFLGTAAGASTGGWIGARSKLRRPVYLAGPSEDANHQAGSMSQPLVVDLDETSTRLSSRQVVRVRGSFGEFTGRVLNIAPDGRVHLDRVPELDSDLPPPSGPIEWVEINRIERRGSSLRRGAAAGAIVAGTLFGSLAALFEGVRTDDYWRTGRVDRRESGKAFAVGALVGAATGATIGGLLGALTPRWHRLVDRPSSASSPTRSASRT